MDHANKQLDGEKNDDMMKAQLHADSLQRHGLEAQATTEVGGERASELPALEPVGSELSANKEYFIRRKAIGSSS